MKMESPSGFIVSSCKKKLTINKSLQETSGITKIDPFLI